MCSQIASFNSIYLPAAQSKESLPRNRCASGKAFTLTKMFDNLRLSQHGPPHQEMIVNKRLSRQPQPQSHISNKHCHLRASTAFAAALHPDERLANSMFAKSVLKISPLAWMGVGRHVVTRRHGQIRDAAQPRSRCRKRVHLHPTAVRQHLPQDMAWP